MPRVGIDFTTLDCLNLSNGQYRYMVDLINGLAELGTFELVVFGSRSEPVPEIRCLFKSDVNGFTYQQVREYKGRLEYLKQHVGYARLAWRYQLDVWHCAHSFVSAFCPCPVVVTEHDLMYHLFGGKWEHGNSKRYAVHRFLVRHRANKVICISRCTQRDLLRFFPMPMSKTVVVHHGTTLHQRAIGSDKVKPNLRELEGRVWVASPYNLEPRKNLAALLRAFQSVVKEMPRALLVLFGRAAVTPEREEKHRSLIEELNLQQNVLETGYLDDGELGWVYHNCTVFAFPSLYEGFGLPLLEAMASGACVIARDASSMAEVVADAGVLVETGEPERLANGMLSVLRDSNVRESMKDRGRKRARMFTVERMAHQTSDVYFAAMGVSDVVVGRLPDQSESFKKA